MYFDNWHRALCGLISAISSVIKINGNGITYVAVFVGLYVLLPFGGDGLVGVAVVERPERGVVEAAVVQQVPLDRVLVDEVGAQVGGVPEVLVLSVAQLAQHGHAALVLLKPVEKTPHQR